jgi:hypothetical protein
VSSIKNLWLQGEKFARNIPRQIDEQTMIDLLAIVEFESVKHSLLDEAGYQIRGAACDCLFDYVLDALQIPPEDDAFSRESFETLFYSDFLIDKRFNDHAEVLAALKKLSVETNQRLQQANIFRANFRPIET